MWTLSTFFSSVLWDYAQKCSNERSRLLHIFYIRVFSLTSPKYFSSKYNDNQTFYMSDKIQHMGGLVDLIRQKVCTRLASLKCAITKVFKQQLIWFTKVWCSGSKFLQRKAHGGLVVGLFVDHQSLFHYICLFTGQHISWWLIFMFHQNMIAKI